MFIYIYILTIEDESEDGPSRQNILDYVCIYICIHIHIYVLTIKDERKGGPSRHNILDYARSMFRKR